MIWSAVTSPGRERGDSAGVVEARRRFWILIER